MPRYESTGVPSPTRGTAQVAGGPEGNDKEVAITSDHLSPVHHQLQLLGLVEAVL